ncbi:DUF1461 domain-containing protein [Candidatus Woesearchaeota archaeon]|nr:DUF1461 domain-containing protein [Candidatus Woesearchaeota archaeon]
MKVKETLFIIFTTVFLFLLSFNLLFNSVETTKAQEEIFHFLEEPETNGGVREGEGIRENQVVANLTLQEKAHLQDVKKILEKVEWGFYILIVILTILFLNLRTNTKELMNLFFSIGKLSIALAAILRFLTLFFFEQSFVVFHLLLFPQGNWMFPVQAELIKIFPLEFFMDFTRTFLFLVLLFGSLFILLPLFWNYGVRSKMD